MSKKKPSWPSYEPAETHCFSPLTHLPALRRHGAERGDLIWAAIILGETDQDDEGFTILYHGKNKHIKNNMKDHDLIELPSGKLT